jgi:HNH endonuclease
MNSLLRTLMMALLLACAMALSHATPSQAKFLSPDTYDPIEPGVDTNRYAYGGNDPINKSDPNGHDSFVAGSPYDGNYACPSGYCGTVDGGIISGWNPNFSPDDEWHQAQAMNPDQRARFFEDTTERRERYSKAAEKAANLASQIIMKRNTKKVGVSNGKLPNDPRKPSAETRRKADQKAQDKDGKLKCKYCGTEMTTKAGKPNSREFDHRKAYAKGGNASPRNIDSICRTCNRGKGASSARQFISNFWKSVTGKK